jgi:hypothetical protein
MFEMMKAWTVAALLVLAPICALAKSTINPAMPQQGMPYDSTTIRNNFQAGANDINGLQVCNQGATPPSSPNSGYCWLNTSNPQLWCSEIYNGVLNTWTPVYAINPITQAVTFGSCTAALFLGLYSGGTLGLYSGGSLELY